jgi:riboflavin kinase/FMN adenylyltransferase
MGGDIRLANAMLGYPYPLSARVVHGNRMGRNLGFPTANLQVENPYKLIPGVGVYAVCVVVDGRKFGGMCNIGYRPTFDQKELVTEVNIFNFEGDIYGASIEVRFVERLREEVRFETKEALMQQLRQDKKQAGEILLDKCNTE